MAHGVPDWDVTAGSRTTYRWSDLDELAARLGSIVTFDRRGDILFLESWEEGYRNWSLTAVGTGSSIGLTLLSARSGAFALRMIPGSDGSRLALAQRIWSYPVFTPFGLEASFTLATNLESFFMGMYVYTGAICWQLWGRYLAATQMVQVYVPPANWVSVFQVPNPIGDPKAFHTFKLVADPSTGRYVRALFDSQAVSLAAYSLTAPAIVQPPQLMVQLQANSIPLNVCTVNLDDIIVTQNEPP